MSLNLILIISVCLGDQIRAALPFYKNQINFIYYGKNSENIWNFDRDPMNLYDPTEPLAVIVHGWTENCDTEWVLDLVKNLNNFRGGCIVCMDYYRFSKGPDYLNLVTHFNPIVQVLTEKLTEFEQYGFKPGNIWMFGFSFGSQILFTAGRKFGHQKISNIVACDPAGPGFDGRPTINRFDVKLSARNVQCIHTSWDKGTHKRECHQNWMMGNCGRTQIGAGPKPKGSHGLCPYFYNNAFHHQFLAIPKPNECRSTRAAIEFPAGFHLGYSENRTNLVNGQDLFAATSKDPPYNRLNENDDISLYEDLTTETIDYSDINY